MCARDKQRDVLEEGRSVLSEKFVEEVLVRIRVELHPTLLDDLRRHEFISDKESQERARTSKPACSMLRSMAILWSRAWCLMIATVRDTRTRGSESDKGVLAPDIYSTKTREDRCASKKRK